MNNKKKIFNLLFYIIGIVVLTELDQITKALAEAKLLGKPDFKIIGDLFFLILEIQVQHGEC